MIRLAMLVVAIGACGRWGFVPGEHDGGPIDGPSDGRSGGDGAPADAAFTGNATTYLKPSNTGTNDQFGFRVALSADGTTLAVSAYYEDSSATGIDGNGADNTALDSGAVYVFVRSGN